MNDGLSIITTHINADFDAMAAMLAAQKLYPDARVVFPGSQDKNLRNFFITSMVYLLNITDINQIDFEAICHIVLVDTRQPSRIGRFAEVLNKPGLQIHIYDHHPDMTGDIKGALEIIEPVGATTTILTETIQARKIDISSDEATIMCLGIYEDTGSFTFSSTTKRDLTAAAYLVGKGANLNLVADLIAREITTEQVGILNDMIQGITTHNINDLEVVLTTVKTDRYIPDFAFLVHKMVNMENYDSIFALAQMENKIYIVGRSRVSDIDVGAILGYLGGGGHAAAASATIRDKTLTQTKHDLIQILQDTIESNRRAENLMSAPAIQVDAGATCRQASGLLNRYNINALIVVKSTDFKTACLGYITRQIIEKAVYHQLGEVPVREYMNTDMAIVHPDAPLFEIQEKIITNKQRIMPVIENNQIIGVITRTDLLNALIHQAKNNQLNPLDQADTKLNVRSRNIVNLMRERLSRRFIDILNHIGQTADELGYGAYVVGGFVRDLFLYRENEDIDIVIEGDGIRFAKTYAESIGGRVHTHSKFGTAVVTFPDGYKIDVASARMEYYTYPAALPIVEMSSIRLDLYRRDFSINTLAVRLNPKWFGTVIDFFSARKDIKEKVIRVLNNLSFVEDPTRVFRAIRFEQRFHFKIGKVTARLIENAVRMDFFKRLSGKRVFTEIKLILEEENPAAAFNRLNDYHLLNVIHPSIQFDDKLSQIFESVRKVIVWYDLLFLSDHCEKWAVYFLALIHPIKRPAAVLEIFTRLGLSPQARRLLGRERIKAEHSLEWIARHPSIKNSHLFTRLSTFKLELVLYMMALTTNARVKQQISGYLTRLRQTKIQLTGKILQAMNIPPGPVYREIFDFVLAAKLDGKISTPDEERQLARKFISRRQPRSPSETG
ncbi:MAG: polya polymerase [Deltaproteobacteria bacterium]|nr:MAG: polya polymerase [Deltaproteobacteria bacterium]